MKRNIYMMYAVALLQGMVFYAPIATLYRTAQGLTISQITLIESISLVLSFVFEVPWGVAADRIGYKKTIVVCNVLYFVSKLIFWKADGFGSFLAERVLLAAVIAGLSGVDVSILYLSAKGEDSQRVFGIYNGLQTVGLLAASWIYSVCIGENYEMAGWMTALSYGLAMAVSLLLVEVKGENAERPSLRKLLGGVREMLSNGRLLLFLIAVACLQQTHQSVTVFLCQLQYERSGMAASMLGAAHMCVTVVGLAGVCSARLTGRMGRRRLLEICCGAGVAACLLLAGTSDPWLSVLAVMALRCAFFVLEPLRTELQNRQVTSEDRATALSLHTVVIDSAAAGISVLFGALAEVNLSLSFLFGAALCGLGAVLFLSNHV